ncbi:peptidase inhibitor family I36 protein [Streptomyces sp. NPDC058394]|uniref:peptidase inhibitor family I36 protein n=1 Tax=Streptomyces sp. NPDC058394 TaxID=3346477 RepID=UPI0036697DE6
MFRLSKAASAAVAVTALLALPSCASSEVSGNAKGAVNAASESPNLTVRDGEAPSADPDTVVICTDSFLFGECSVAPTTVEDLSVYKDGVFNDSISSIINSHTKFQICFYAEANFRGASFAIGPGVEVDDVNDFDSRLVAENFNDKVSSFRLFQNRTCI